MSESDRYIPGVPCWIDTSQPDPQAAVEFYGGLFGWEFESVMPPDSPGEYHIGRIRGEDVGAIGSIPEGMPAQAMWNTYIWVDSADETASMVTGAGGSVLTEPFDVPGSGRMGVFADPEGAAFCVWEAREHRGAQVVNEHGSLNFNSLNTREPEVAKAFYGSVFGWGVLEMDGGFTAWTLAGYGDHLMKRDPELRARIKETGGPDGFENVVASMSAIPDDQPDTPPHWGVTFAVDDADAIAAKAAELGATVVMPPMDLPWVRMTVLTDPQGATFIASKYVPENKDLATEAAAGSA